MQTEEQKKWGRPGNEAIASYKAATVMQTILIYVVIINMYSLF